MPFRFSPGCACCPDEDTDTGTGTLDDVGTATGSTVGIGCLCSALPYQWRLTLPTFTNTGGSLAACSNPCLYCAEEYSGEFLFTFDPIDFVWVCNRTTTLCTFGSAEEETWRLLVSLSPPNCQITLAPAYSYSCGFGIGFAPWIFQSNILGSDEFSQCLQTITLFQTSTGGEGLVGCAGNPSEVYLEPIL